MESVRLSERQDGAAALAGKVVRLKSTLSELLEDILASPDPAHTRVDMERLLSTDIESTKLMSEVLLKKAIAGRDEEVNAKLAKHGQMSKQSHDYAIETKRVLYRDIYEDNTHDRQQQSPQRLHDSEQQ